ncbi:MAG: PilZ domain-containing protein [Pyrinomonadaceae bacterium]
MKPDRRSGGERRSAMRYRLLLDLEYEDSSGRHRGTLSDISEEGCFILGGGETRDGEALRIFFPLSAGMKVEFAGWIANHVFEIGFAVRFDDLTSAQKDFIGNFIEEHKDVRIDPDRKS